MMKSTPPSKAPPGAIWRQLLDDAAEIRSAYGFLTMRMAVAKDAQDAYDVAKREFAEHEAAFRRLETSIPQLRACADDLETAPSPRKVHEEEDASRVGGVPGVGHGDLSRKDRNGVLIVHTKNIIPAFVALRLRDVASFNGCVGRRDGICIELSPDDPVEWCKYCVQGEAAKIIEALADAHELPVPQGDLVKDLRWWANNIALRDGIRTPWESGTIRLLRLAADALLGKAQMETSR